MVWNGGVLYFLVLHCIVLHCIVLYCVVLYCILFRGIAWFAWYGMVVDCALLPTLGEHVSVARAARPEWRAALRCFVARRRWGVCGVAIVV